MNAFERDSLLRKITADLTLWRDGVAVSEGDVVVIAACCEDLDGFDEVLPVLSAAVIVRDEGDWEFMHTGNAASIGFMASLAQYMQPEE